MKKVEVVKGVIVQSKSILGYDVINGLVDELELTDVPDFEDYKKEINDLKSKVKEINLALANKAQQLEHISKQLDVISKQLQSPQFLTSMIDIIEKQVSKLDKCAVKNEKKCGAITKKG